VSPAASFKPLITKPPNRKIEKVGPVLRKTLKLWLIIT
jgi:hypothetical protein